MHKFKYIRNLNISISAFKKSANVFHSNDISRKVRSALKQKRENGEYIANMCPYGYIKEKNSSGKYFLRVNELLADVIRSIFSMRINGISPLKIAEILNERNIPTPGAEKDFSKGGTGKSNQNYKWTYHSVQRILDNEAYIGTIIQDKKGEQLYLYDFAPAIVTHDDFYLVKKIKEMSTHSSTSSLEHLFTGLLYCYDCNKLMLRKNTKLKDGIKIWYGCSTRLNKITKNECTMHKIEHNKLYYLVNAEVQQYLSQIKQIKAQYDHKINDLLNQKLLLEKTIIELDSDELLMSIDSNISEHSKSQMTLTYTSKINHIDSLINFYNNLIVINGFNWLEFYSSVSNCNLTRELLIRLIDKIFIITEERIKIIYRFEKEMSLLSANL